jgi:arginase family enzyme
VLGQARPDLLRHAAGRQCLTRDCIYILCTRQTASPQGALVRRLGLRVAYADDLRKTGFHRLLSSAFAAIAPRAEPLGISIDLHAVDLDVGSAGPDGDALAAAFRDVVPSTNLLGLEIVGYDPYVDLDGRRAELICDLAAAVLARDTCLPAPSASQENAWRRERKTG